MESKAPPGESTGLRAFLWRRPQRWFLLGIPIGGLLAFLIGVGLTGGFIAALKYTETNAFCTSCHGEHDQTLAELKQSVHYSNVFGIQASCGDCHVPPKFLPGLWRHVEAVTELWGHFNGVISTPARYEAHRAELAQKIWKEFKANNSAECRRCHNPSAMAKQPEMAAEAHASLPTSGMTCIDCHQGVAHKLPAGS